MGFYEYKLICFIFGLEHQGVKKHTLPLLLLLLFQVLLSLLFVVVARSVAREMIEAVYVGLHGASA
jgi:hypothetical protein